MESGEIDFRKKKHLLPLLQHCASASASASCCLLLLQYQTTPTQIGIGPRVSESRTSVASGKKAPGQGQGPFAIEKQRAARISNIMASNIMSHPNVVSVPECMTSAVIMSQWIRLANSIGIQHFLGRPVRLYNPEGNTYHTDALWIGGNVVVAGCNRNRKRKYCG
jgi:hypothetical protein